MAALTAGAKAPDFELKAMDGKRFVLRDELIHGPIVLAFFKVSCPTENMKKRRARARRPAGIGSSSRKRIAELGDWRGAKTLSRMRKLIKEADPDAVEEWKWRGTPVWSHDGIICTGESYKKVVKLTFAKGASLKDPAISSTRVSTETYAARSTSTKEKKLTSPPSRRSFARRSPSTVSGKSKPSKKAKS
jgi:hypothetical protein